MGQSGSSPQNGADVVYAPPKALHVLRVTPGSPASQTDIEPYFDFVLGVEGAPESHERMVDAVQLERLVETHEGKAMNLMVWSSKTNNVRQVLVVPSRLWVSEFTSSLDTSPHPLSPSHSRNTSLESISRIRKPSLLGLTMRLCEPESALDNVWHILEVMEGSPAESAGLVPYGDWIVGWSGGVLRGENDFLEVVEAHVDKPLRVYVYSYDFDTLREVVLVPNRMWGGEGLLGCGVGFGLLHRIPRPNPEQGPDTLQDHFQQNDAPLYDEEAELFVPADDIVDDNHSDGRPLHSSDPHRPLRIVPTQNGLSSQTISGPDEATPIHAPVPIQLIPKQPLSVFTADDNTDDSADNGAPTPTQSSPISPKGEAPQTLSRTLSPPTRNAHFISNSSALGSGSPILRQFSNPAFGASRFGSIQTRIPSPVPRSSLPRMAHGIDSDEEGDDRTASTRQRSNGSVTSVDD
ncbi:GRASP55/65 PDZ-like domain-containing protein [Cantharellus anzutake]|uniref:GRASP55/65 PDZ-like domain-containing protein n=1 Tax=Cantharellus anzutake TaxID=1750568 RepID=UPI0019044E4F|nr:GRASP55/65 PDZ-like domain-containing protein [Cantharellus anzutake]KAF8339602.1 GRASP55/65 PDZ-like domain-containing protein [Cantharellus anzutake]